MSLLTVHYINNCSETGEMAKQLKVLTVLPVDPNLIPNIHMVGHNHLEFQFRGSNGVQGHRHRHAGKYPSSRYIKFLKIKPALTK